MTKMSKKPTRKQRLREAERKLSFIYEILGVPQASLPSRGGIIHDITLFHERISRLEAAVQRDEKGGSCDDS